MELQWRFKINGTIVKEPIGWDGIAITLKRDEVYHGLENTFTDNIVFWDTGAQIIKDAFETDGIDAALEFTSEYSCDGGSTWTFFITGILNAFFYQIINNEVTIKIEPSGFQRKVKNRLTIPINLSSTTSIGGETISDIEPFDLGLHSKTLRKQSSNIANPALLSVDDNHTFADASTHFNRIEFPLQIVSNELQTMNETSSIFTFDALPLASDSGIPFFTIDESGEMVIDYKIKGTLFHSCENNTQFNFSLLYGYGNDATQNQTTLQTAFYSNPAFSVQTINFDYSGTFTIPNGFQGKQVWFLITVFNYLNSAGTAYQPSFFTLDTDPTTGIIVTQETTQDPSTSKAFLIHEAYAKISESMTDEIDSFRSDYYGRTNSEPHLYADNGCGAYKAITNGLNLRKMLDKNGNIFPIFTTFQDLFTSSNAIDNLGMRVERDSSTGKEYVRVEPKEFFYNPTPIINCFNISDLKIYPAQESIYNQFKIGYSKWNLNISKTNAIDEINATHSYTIPVKNANKELTQMSSYIAAGYVIEETRRQQYFDVPTNDFETDNDLFFICTNVNEVTSDKYTVPAVSTTYQAGEVSERDENFSSITNLINPQTAYNLRISPTRNALNWYNYISASVYKHPTSPIKFINGTGNYQESDDLDNFCVFSEVVSQDQNLNATNLISGNTPIYSPEYLEFTYPISFSDFILIMNNSEKAIGVSCSDELQFIGFINTLKYTPNTKDGGIAEFKLLRGSCVPGDFNNDFNNDFNLGTCS